MRRRETLAVLGERDFRNLFLARSISFLGGSFAPVALAFAVLDDLDASATALGAVLAAAWVPQIALLLAGGVWADRLPRNLVMVSSDAAMALAQGASALLLLLDRAEVWHLIVLQLVRGTASAFFFPASTGLVPTVVSASRLQQANALLRLTQNGAVVGGAALAGLVVAAVGSGWALGFDALTFVVSAMFLLRIRLPRREASARDSFASELREGWSEFASRTWLWAIVVQFMLVNGLAHSAILILGPLIAKEHLGGAAAWGLILAAEGIGMIIGGLIALRAQPRRILLVATLAVFLFAPHPLLLAMPAPLLVLLGSAVILGVGIEIFGVMWDTAMQQQIPEEKLSRVYSYDMLGSFVAIPIGLSVAGPVADLIGVGATLVGAAAITLVATALVLTSRDVRTLRRAPPAPTPAPEAAAAALSR